MEKVFKNLLPVLLVLTLLTLCSCAEKNDLLDLESDVSEPTSFSFKTEYTEYDSDVEVISYTIENISSEMVGINPHAFSLHYKCDGEWKLVAFDVDDDFYIYDILFGVEPDKPFESEIELTEYFNLPLESGEYRIVIEGFTSNVFTIK